MIAWTLPRARLWALFTTGLMAPLAVAALVRLAALPARSSVVAPPEERVLRCDATRLAEGASGCPADLHCVAGRCEALRFAVRGGPGAVCAAELCAPGLECAAERCTAPEDVSLAPPLCRPAEVQAVIAALRRRCGVASLDDCPVETWQRMNATDPHFESLLTALPGLITVHFPVDKPDVAGRWTTDAVRASYRAQLGAHAEALRGARRILVIGRASVEGGREHNRDLATRRSELVVEVVSALIGPEPPALRWSLASDHALSPERFKSEVLTTPVTWSPSETAWLSAALREDLKRLAPPAWRRVLNTINRVVLVVPLYCDGGEFQPTPAFQGHQRVEP